MRRAAIRLAVLGLIAVAVAPAGLARVEHSPDAALLGRVAGAPRECIGAIDRERSTSIYDDGSILFRGRGDTIYLNRPAGCPLLRSNRGIVTRTPTGALCRGDIVTVIDPPVPDALGSCSLGGFVPYARRAK